MGLVRARADQEHLNAIRNNLENSHFLDRVRSTVTQINREAGHQLIESQEFLPPARLVSRLRFRRGKTDFCLEIAVRPTGPKAIFYTVKKLPRGIQRFFNSNATNRISTAYKVFFRPEAVTNDDVQAWCTYLVSEFKAKFEPETDKYRNHEAGSGGMNSVGLLDSI